MFASGSSCTLSALRTCAVTVVGGGHGYVDVTATYGGDSNNVGSSGETGISVYQPYYTASGPVTCPTTNPIGVSIWIVNSTAPPGTLSTYYVTDLGNLGSGTTGLQTINYYEIQVEGVSDGVAIVCINGNHLPANTQIVYYYGGWRTAKHITVISGGSAVMGDIPVVALLYPTLVTFGPPIDPPPATYATATPSYNLLLSYYTYLRELHSGHAARPTSTAAPIY
jgi:hypothetical protein